MRHCFTCTYYSLYVRDTQINETKLNYFLLFIYVYFLKKLPPVLNLQELEEYRDKLKQQQAAVSKNHLSF